MGLLFVRIKLLVVRIKLLVQAFTPHGSFFVCMKKPILCNTQKIRYKGLIR